MMASSSQNEWSIGDVVFNLAWCYVAIEALLFAYRKNLVDVGLALAGLALFTELHALIVGSTNRVTWLAEFVGRGAWNGVAWLARGLGSAPVAEAVAHVRDLWLATPIVDHALVRTLLRAVLAAVLFDIAMDYFMFVRLDPGGVAHRVRAALRRFTRLFTLWLHPAHVDVWNCLGNELAAGERVVVGGREMTKRDCYLEALRLDPAHVVTWCILSIDLAAGERIVVGEREMGKRDCYLEAARLDPTYAACVAHVVSAPSLHA
jgi:hypothetical protein